MNSARVLSSAGRGVKWTLLLSFLAMPVSHLTNVFFGRISPELLGAYGTVAIFVSLVDSVFLLGGRQTLIQFVPNVPVEKRWSFAASNLLLVAGTSVILGALLSFHPEFVGEGLAAGLTQCSGSFLR